MLPFTLDEIAQMSEESAIRRRFDLRNFAALKWVLPIFGVISIAEVATATQDWSFRRIAVSLFNAVLVVALFIFVRRLVDRLEERNLTPWFEPFALHGRAFIVLYLLVQFGLVIIFAYGGEGLDAWLINFPWFTLPFRLVASEFFLLHGVYMAVSVVEAIIAGRFTASGHIGPFVGACVTNAFSLAIVLYTSRRFRRQFISQWSLERDRVREQMRMRQELEYAREMQLSMLPRESPRLNWLQVSSVSLPASEVGGDYYDYFVLDDERVAVVVADVAGHGLGSGLVLSGVRSCLTLLSDELSDLQSVLAKLQKMLLRTSQRRMLVTMSLVLADRRQRTVTVASAGHPPAILRQGTTPRLLELSSVPLGTKLSSSFPETSVTFAAGDVLVLHTDGIYEATDRQGEPYGLDRLTSVVSSEAEAATAQEVRDAILRDVWTYKGDQPQADDVTLVVMKFLD